MVASRSPKVKGPGRASARPSMVGFARLDQTGTGTRHAFGSLLAGRILTVVAWRAAAAHQGPARAVPATFRRRYPRRHRTALSLPFRGITAELIHVDRQARASAAIHVRGHGAARHHSRRRVDCDDAGGHFSLFHSPGVKLVWPFKGLDAEGVEGRNRQNFGPR